jgi:hypothetical protein
MMDGLTESEYREARELVDALKANGYVAADVARALGVHCATVLRRMRRYGLDSAVVANNPRLAARRQNKELPPAPHEPSRQAREQAENRERGMCGCGKPTEPIPGRLTSKSCAGCRARWRRAKS